MQVGSLRVRLLVRESRSLKDKRQVVRGILDRLRNDFNVAASEVGALDHRQLVVLGFATVAGEAAQVAKTLEAVLRALRGHPIAEFLDAERDA
jgi:uncharacterized protein YlxP (DUF503 family)